MTQLKDFEMGGDYKQMAKTLCPLCDAHLEWHPESCSAHAVGGPPNTKPFVAKCCFMDFKLKATGATIEGTYR